MRMLTHFFLDSGNGTWGIKYTGKCIFTFNLEIESYYIV